MPVGLSKKANEPHRVLKRLEWPDGSFQSSSSIISSIRVFTYGRLFELFSHVLVPQLVMVVDNYTVHDIEVRVTPLISTFVRCPVLILLVLHTRSSRPPLFRPVLPELLIASILGLHTVVLRNRIAHERVRMLNTVLQRQCQSTVAFCFVVGGAAKACYVAFGHLFRELHCVEVFGWIHDLEAERGDSVSSHTTSTLDSSKFDRDELGLLSMFLFHLIG